MDTVRFGIIGIGNMGSSHALSLRDQKIANGKLTAVCDIRKCRRDWAKQNLPQVAVFADYRDLLSCPNVDSIIIATPHYLHPPIAIDAFAAGLHVMTEKPAGVRVSDVEKMNRAADESGKIFGIMLNQRTSPLFSKARELVQSGALGNLQRLTWIITNWFRTQSYYDSGTWRGSYLGEGGGVLLNQAPHNLDLLQWIFGMPNSVFALCDTGLYHDIEVEDRATLLLSYANGAQAQFITTTGEYPGTNRLEICGDLGKLILENGKLLHYQTGFSVDAYRKQADTASCNRPCTCHSYSQTAPESAHNGVLNAFVRAILYQEPLVADGREGIRMVTLTNAAYLSAWTGKPVDLPVDHALFDRLLDEKRAKSVLRQESALFEDPEDTNISRWKINW